MIKEMKMQCPDCGSGRRSDGYHREGWYWLECDRRYNPETDTYSPENNWCRLKQRDAEIETLKRATKVLKPAWVCEFCFACLLEGDLPTDWDLVFLSAVCPSCQKKVAQDGGYHSVPGGSYSDGRKDPRAYADIRKGKND